MTTRGRVCAWVVVPALAGTITEACSNDSRPEPIAIEITSFEDLVLPLDAYIITLGDVATIDHARDVLVAECMQAQGFSFPVITRTGEAERQNERRYGLTDAPAARVFGYRPTPLPEGLVEEREQVSDYEAGLSVAESRALVGDAVDTAYTPESCFGQAIEAMGLADLRADLEWAASLVADARRRYEADPRVSAANNAWSTCMQQAGYEFSDPLAAMDDPRWSGSITDQPVTAQEIDTAQQDIMCKEETDYLESLFGLESAYQTDLLEENEVRLSDIRQRLDTIRRSAAEGRLG